MYRVVGCPDCRSLWITEPGGDTAQCPSCRQQHAIEALRTLAETETIDAARDARSRLLAERAGYEQTVSTFTEAAADLETAARDQQSEHGNGDESVTDPSD